MTPPSHSDNPAIPHTSDPPAAPLPNGIDPDLPNASDAHGPAPNPKPSSSELDPLEKIDHSRDGKNDDKLYLLGCESALGTACGGRTADDESLAGLMAIGSHVFCASCLYPPPLEEGGEVPQCETCGAEKMGVIEVSKSSFDEHHFTHLLNSADDSLTQIDTRQQEIIKQQQGLIQQHQQITQTIAQLREALTFQHGFVSNTPPGCMQVRTRRKTDRVAEGSYSAQPRVQALEGEGKGVSEEFAFTHDDCQEDAS